MNEVITQRMRDAFAFEQPIARFAESMDLPLALGDPQASNLCEEVLFSQPLCCLGSVLDLVCQRLMEHANLFTRFPGHMMVLLCDRPLLYLL